MTGNAKEFIDLYNELDGFLKRKFKLQENVGFSSKVNRAKEERLITTKQKEYLLLVGNLRNAILHEDKHKFPEDPIAEPHPETVERLRQLKELIETPPTVDNLPKNQPTIFKASDLLLYCLQYMRQNDFSQVVVFADPTYALITREDIARWFETQIDKKEIVVSLEDVRLAEILSLDDKDDCKFLARTARLTELIDKFESHGRTRVAAVLITNNGKATEKPLNIFTQYDIPDIISKIDTF